MKKIIVSICVFVVLMATILTPAFGQYYSYQMHGVNFKTDYIYTGYQSTPLTIRYNPKSLFMYARATTELNVAIDEYGTAYVRIEDAQGNYVHQYGTTRHGLWISSGKIEFYGLKYAFSTFHSAERVTCGVTNAWVIECD